MEFSNEERDIIVSRIQKYFRDELDQEIGQFDAGFLLDFFGKEVGRYYYNRGLYDAQAILSARLDSICEAVDELEKPTEFSR